MNVTASISARTAGEEARFPLLLERLRSCSGSTRRGSSTNFCLQTADLPAFGRPEHWHKVACCLPGRCGGAAAAFCCRHAGRPPSRLGEESADAEAWQSRFSEYSKPASCALQLSSNLSRSPPPTRALLLAVLTNLVSDLTAVLLRNYDNGLAAGRKALAVD